MFAGAVMRTGVDAGAPNAGTTSRSAAESGRGFDEVSRRCRLPQRARRIRPPGAHPELAAVRDRLRDWRFYDGFRVDATAPARLPRVGTRTPVLSDDGGDLAAAVQTIIEAGFDDLPRAVADAFDGATVSVAVHDGLFELQLHQRGMLRPLRAAELSDGTLRFLLWARRAAEPAAAVADGAQRAGDVTAPRPGARRWRR